MKDARAIAALLVADKEFGRSRNRPPIHPLAMELVELKSRDVNELLVAALPTSDPAIRASIIFVLSQENDASLAALLMPYLDDAETSVRAQVAKWIGRSRDASRVDELLQALARETGEGHADPERSKPCSRKSPRSASFAIAVPPARWANCWRKRKTAA